MQIYLLDMGSKIYGDCILAVEGNRKILIDGAHPGDWRASPRTLSIPQQLARIIGPKPFKIDLLIVTHCHSDHIGCLPKMVSDETIVFDWALVADETLGFPAEGQDAALDAETRKVIAGLAEEPQPDLQGAALDEFLSDAVKLADSYKEMLSELENRNTKVIRYTGPASAREVEQEFGDFNLRVLGPTNGHLVICSEALARLKRGVRDAVDSMRQADAALDAGQMYRRLVSGTRSTDAAIPDDLRTSLDRAGPGAALNDQSIVIKIGSADESVLLTGDMQLAAPEITGLDSEMDALLDTIAEAGPYKFVKLPHHASYNGFDQKVLDAFKDTSAFGISTGRGDPAHPDNGVLRLLASTQQKWARTDRNGGISVEFKNGNVEIGVARGELDDDSPNAADVLATTEEESSPPEVPQPQPKIEIALPPEVERGSTTTAGNSVEVFARIPHVKTRVTITVDVEPRDSVDSKQTPVPPPNGRKELRPDVTPPPRQLAPGREIPPLLFVTNSRRLALNIGTTEAADAISAINAAK
jgi:hypothetical protein